MQKVLKLDSKDNVLIALTDLRQGEQVSFDSQSYILESDVPAKHAQHPSSSRSVSGKNARIPVDAARRVTMEAARIPGISPIRRPGRHAKLLDCCSAGVLRKPKHRGAEAGV